MYVLEDEDGIQASFVFYCGIDPCYNKIYDGQWLMMNRMVLFIVSQHEV